MAVVVDISDYAPEQPESGFILLHRSLQESAFASDPEALALWVHLLMMANHAPRDIKIGGNNITVNRGEFVTGRQALAKVSGISEKKIRMLLDYFETEEMITRIRTNRYSIIRIENYEKFQNRGQQRASKMGQQKGQQKGQLEAAEMLGLDQNHGQQKGQQKGQQRATNKEYINTIPNTDVLGICPQQADGRPESTKPEIPPCPHSKIIDLYHETLPELPRVLKNRWQGSARARELAARWKESAEHRSRDFWTAYFEAVRTQGHQMGNNDRNWRADLGWLVKRGNFDKMVERFIAQGVWQ